MSETASGSEWRVLDETRRPTVGLLVLWGRGGLALTFIERGPVRVERSVACET